MSVRESVCIYCICVGGLLRECVRVNLALLTACDGGGGRLRTKDTERLSKVRVA